MNYFLLSSSWIRPHQNDCKTLFTGFSLFFRLASYRDLLSGSSLFFLKHTHTHTHTHHCSCNLCETVDGYLSPLEHSYLFSLACCLSCLTSPCTFPSTCPLHLFSLISHSALTHSAFQILCESRFLSSVWESCPCSSFSCNALPQPWPGISGTFPSTLPNLTRILPPWVLLDELP